MTFCIRFKKTVALSLAIACGQLAAGQDTGWVQWSISEGGNDHWYRAISAPDGITWEQARAAAEAEGGYLATVTSAEENDFLNGTLATGPANNSFWFQPDNAFGPWIGLLQTPGSAEPDSGWRWITGEPMAFTQWAPGAPDNGNPNEDFGILFWLQGSSTFGWQDCNNDGRLSIAGHPVISYIVERDDAGHIVYPGSYAINSGYEADGILRSLFYADDSRLCVFGDDLTLTAEVTISGTSPYVVPSKLRFSFESSVARSGLSQTVRLGNYAASAYVVVDGRVATGEDSSFEVVFTSHAAEYVGPNGVMRAKVTWSPINDEAPSQDGWVHCIDLVRWVVEP